jgi:DNA-binding NarL/FixJ family response regulator
MQSQVNQTVGQPSFRVLLVDERPYETLDALALVPVIQTTVCRETRLASVQLEQQEFNAALIQVHDQSAESIEALRQANPDTPMIGVANRATESLALELVNGPLDDYLLHDPTSDQSLRMRSQARFAEAIARACRVAGRLRSAHLALQSQVRINSRLRHDAQRCNRGLETLASIRRSDIEMREGLSDERRSLLRDHDEDELRVIAALRKPLRPFASSCQPIRYWNSPLGP